MPTPPGQRVFQLRIQLENVSPAIWRRVLVPGSVRLGKLHHVLQAAMGWTDSHLHSFTIGDKRYGMQFDDFPEGELDETEVTVLQALRDVGHFLYEYDFGDGWEHEVVVEDMTSMPNGLKYAVCLEGERACPPEDCGGPHMYGHLLEVLSDPSHEEFPDYEGWIEDSFDSEAFDLATVNAALQRVR